jgi:DNA end-binding protein Ku
MALRPYWTGHIRLSLVSPAVKIFPALNRSRHIALHEIYRRTGQRVHHLNVIDDKPIDKDDIIKGYEVEKGEYVLIDSDEIKHLKVPSKEVLEIVEFVSADAIDDVYLETPYFIVPKDKNAQDAFVVIREALRQNGKIGLGQLSIGGHERLCAVKPYGSGMLLETLRYEDEVKKADPFFSEIGKRTIGKNEIAPAKELIKQKTTTFKLTKFHDHYREALEELIDSKREHRRPKDIISEKPDRKVTNLMDALRKSLKQKATGKSSKAAAKKPQRGKHNTKTKPTRKKMKAS